jgi:hypothetical protein
MKHERGDLVFYWVKCDKCLTETHYCDTEEETIAAWNRRANPLQKWEAGSEPPDGWYFIVGPQGKTVCQFIDKTIATPSSVVGMFDRTYWESWLSHCKVYGPIPEPEVEA